jgi:hypothetical protein
VVTSGGSITSITAENNRYATSRLKTSGTSTLAIGIRNSNQNLPDQTETIATYTSATDSIYATVNTTTGNFTVLESGVYLASTRYALTYNATSIRAFSYRVNGTIQGETVIEFAATAIGSIAGVNRNMHHYVVSLNAGDTLSFNVYQSSGITLNLTAARTVLARLG